MGSPGSWQLGGPLQHIVKVMHDETMEIILALNAKRGKKVKGAALQSAQLLVATTRFLCCHAVIGHDFQFYYYDAEIVTARFDNAPLANFK